MDAAGELTPSMPKTASKWDVHRTLWGEDSEKIATAKLWNTKVTTSLRSHWNDSRSIGVLSQNCSYFLLVNHYHLYSFIQKCGWR